MKKLDTRKNIPLFPSERAEAQFWDTTDSTEYFSGKGGIRLKLPARNVSVSIRLPQRLIERLKRLARMKDVPYQSLLKIYLDEKVRDEMLRLHAVTA